MESNTSTLQALSKNQNSKDGKELNVCVTFRGIQLLDFSQYAHIIRAENFSYFGSNRLI